MNRLLFYVFITVAALVYVVWFSVTEGVIRWPMVAACALLGFRSFGYFRAWRQHQMTLGTSSGD